MTLDDSTPRKLCYPLVSNFSETPYDTPEGESVAFLDLSQWPTVDSSERIRLVFDWSLDELVAMATSIDVGRDIAYNEQAGIAWWIWVRGLISMTICDDVANCIETSEATQQALADVILNNETIFNAINEQIRRNGVNTPTGAIEPTDTINGVGATDTDEAIGVIPDCTNDKLWGALRFGVVQYLEDNALNFLEDMNTIADKGQRAQRIVSGIPIIGNVLSATIAAFVEAIPDLLNLFNSYASETVKNDIACELFEQLCETCELPTYGTLLNYYKNLGVTGYDDLENVAFQLATDLLIGSSTLSGSVVYHSIIAYELAVLYLGHKFNQATGIQIIDVWAQLGIDFGNDNWDLLCDGCGTGEWCNFFDFTLGNQSFVPLPAAPHGQQNASGYQMTYGLQGGLNDNRQTPDREFGVDFTPNLYEIKYVGTAGGASRVLQLVGDNDNALVFLRNFGAYDTSGVEQTLQYTTVHTIDEIRFSCTANLPSASDPDSLTIKSLKITGETGLAPDTENC